MRGGPAAGGRAAGSPAMRPVNETNSQVRSVIAPDRGWNARGNLANMQPNEAIQLDNIFPGVQAVTLRKGSIDWKTAAPATVHSLMPYTGLTVNKLFAATNANIYDVTASGAFGAAAVSCTNGFWKSLMMATSGGNFLFAVNGVDNAKLFDGAAWTIPIITGVSSANWNYITVHKHRIWAIEKNTMNLWYLGTDSIAGAATQFPVGALFSKGGYLVACGSWSYNTGFGLNQFFVIVTSAGELAIYSGTDPASSASWALVGVFATARPVGANPLLNLGGDLLYLSTIGLIPLTKLLQASVVDLSSAISYNIDGAFLDAASSYAAIPGWQMLTNNAINMLIVNVPVTQDVLSYQFVMNTITKAWCRFTGWNASCWAEFNGDIYFGGGLKVCKAWTGANDSGKPIIGVCAQAYNNLGSSLNKEVTLVRPNFGFTGAAQIQLALDVNFNTFNGQTQFSYIPSSSGGLWDSGLWDGTTWDSGVSIFEPKWTTVPGNVGAIYSLRMQITASSGNFVWTSTDYTLRGAGIL